MKKDITRDYAVSAFRLWARLGFPSAEALKISGEGDFALLADVAACEKCFRLLENEEGGLICAAVREVYMRNPSRGLYKREITGRVIRLQLSLPCAAAILFPARLTLRIVCSRLCLGRDIIML